MALETTAPVTSNTFSVCEAEVVARSRMLLQLHNVGICTRELVCVHSPLSGPGFVTGGARTLIDCSERGERRRWIDGQQPHFRRFKYS
jgi:hypothetical protein